MLGLALLVGTGVTILNQDQSAQAADTGDATLTSVTTTQVGTNQTGEDATHILNNNIIKYQANYTFTTAGTVTVTATLPSGMIWSDATVVTDNGCGTGSSLNTDKNIATCVLSNTNIGITSWSLSATVYGGNGATVQPTFTDSSGVSTTKPTAVTIVASPKYDLQFARNDTNFVQAPTAAQQLAGLDGLNIYYSYGLSSATPVLGLEPLQNGAYSLTFDMSAFPSNWSVANCNTVNGVSAWPHTGPSNATASAVKQSGTADCHRSPDGSTLTISVSGAYTGGLDYPPLNDAHNPITRAYYSTKSFSINIPENDLTSSGVSYVMTPNSLTASGVSGAANTGNIIVGSSTVNVSSTPIYEISTRYIRTYKVGTSSVANDALVNTWATGPLIIGQDLDAFAIISQLIAPAGVRVNHPQGCFAFDPSTIRLNSASLTSEWTSRGYTADIEYGVVSGTPSSIRADCGLVGDGRVEWYSDLGAAQAAGQVSAVRYRVNGYIMSNPIDSNIMVTAGVSNVVRLNFHVEDSLTPGAPISMSAKIWSDDTVESKMSLDPVTYRAISASLKHTVGFSKSVLPTGDTETVIVTPVIKGGTAPNVTETVTLPSSLTYVPGSAKFGGVGIADPVVDSNGKLVFELGNLAAEQTTQLTFNVNVASSIIMPSTATVTAVIGSDESSYIDESLRTASAAFNIAAPAQFGVSLNQSKELLQPGMDQTYGFTIYNTTSSAVTGITEIDVLPYNGSRGTNGLTSYRVSEFSGSAGLALYYTTAEAVRTNPSSGSVAWVAYSSGVLPSNVTALKWTIAAMPGSSSAQVTVTLSDIVASNGAVVGNSVSYVSSNLGSMSEPIAKSADYKIASISGTVYRDVDLSGSYTVDSANPANSDIPLDGRTVQLKQGNTVISSTSTDNNGHYSFNTLPSGTYSIVLAATPTNMVSNGDVASNFSLIAGSNSTNNNLGFVLNLDPADDSAEITIAANNQPNPAYTIDVLANDKGANGEDSTGLTISEAPYISSDDNCFAPLLGVVEITTDTITYTANPGATGMDSFCYQVSDSFNQTAFARVIVTLESPPIIVAGIGIPDTGMGSVYIVTAITVVATFTAIVILMIIPSARRSNKSFKL